MAATPPENHSEASLPAERLRVLIIAAGDDTGQSEQPEAARRLAGALAPGHDVVLAVPVVGGPADRSFAVVYYNRRNLALLARDSDVVIPGPGAAEQHPELLELGPVAASPLSALMEGDLGHGRRLERSAGTGEINADELFIIRPVPARPPKRGLSYYRARFRYLMRTGGPRYVAARAAAKLKRKMGGR